jgi:hypothetical protein
MNRLLATLAATLLLMPALGLAAERTGKVMVGDIELTVPVPDGYVQASLDMPHWLDELKAAVIPGTPMAVEALVAPECISEESGEGVYCVTSYEIFVTQRPFSSLLWPKVRPQILDELERNSAEMLRRVHEARVERNQQMGVKDEFSLDTEAPIVMLAPEDMRSIRFRLRAPLEIESDGQRIRQWRFGGQFMLHGKLFSVSVVRNLPADADDQAVVKVMEAELEAFARELYALNPMHAAR